MECDRGRVKAFDCNRFDSLGAGEGVVEILRDFGDDE